MKHGNFGLCKSSRGLIDKFLVYITAIDGLKTRIESTLNAVAQVGAGLNEDSGVLGEIGKQRLRATHVGGSYPDPARI